MQKILQKALPVTINLLDKIAPNLAGKLSFRLFYYPKARSKLYQTEADLLQQAEHSSFEINNKTVKIYRWGNGQPVLFVHGFESRGARVAPFVNKLLSYGYQIITFDAPGHGESSGTDTNILEFQAIINHIAEQYGTFAGIIAHSIGVMCTFYALKQGVQAKKIVAISGVCELSYLTQQTARTLKLPKRTHDYLNLSLERLFHNHENIWEKFSADSFEHSLNAELLIIHDLNDPMVDYTQAEKLYLGHLPKTPIMNTVNLGHRRILHNQKVIDAGISFICKETNHQS